MNFIEFHSQRRHRTSAPAASPLDNIVSVIVPVRNEASNIPSLLERLDATFKKASIKYEVIVVDDYSTDSSYDTVTAMRFSYPVRVYRKKGVIGKGTSIIEGIEKSHGDILAVIDADLSYPPEAIPEMITMLQDAAIVVANRDDMDSERKFKRLAARLSNAVFGRAFFGLNFDVHTGLKVFKKEVVNSITLNPSKWSFHLEMLLKAMNAGFEVVGYPVKHTPRKSGQDSMNIVQSLVELTLLSLRYWISPFEPVVLKKQSAVDREIVWKHKRFKPYTTLHPRNSAIKTVTRGQVAFFLLLIAAVAALFVYNWKEALVIVVSVLTAVYFADLLFNLYLIVSSLRKDPAIQINENEFSTVTEWPSYTIMCPLYKEWEVVPQFTQAIENLDYPKDKLQVLIVLEEDDRKTQEEIAKMTLPSYFEVLVTPHHQPKTKPKACNYALLKATGDYVVIYDAEDIPDPLQLKKAIVAFKKLEKDNVVCLQAKLNFYNVHQNLLTRLFTLEYTLWFNLVLTGLHSIGAPIPLGGTSNHFRRSHLTLLQGWDPFNVTEDCDLGIRLFKYGYKTKVLNSVTLEEANSSFFGWFPQRSRWIKGYIQTYLVHMRRPHEFITDWSNPHLLTFQLIVGGKVLSMWINPFLWIMTASYFIFRSQIGPFIESLYLTPVFYLGVISLIFGNFLYLYYYMIGAARRGAWDLIKYGFVVPAYWLMMSYASWMALYQIFFKPHYWEKTKHGLHLAPPKLHVA